LIACPVGTYEASSLCVACPEGQTTSSRGATSASECSCAACVFTNNNLNGLVAEHAPHSVYVGEAWDVGSGTLLDLSGNMRHANLMVVPSTDSQRQGWAARYRMLRSAPQFYTVLRNRAAHGPVRDPCIFLFRNPSALPIPAASARDHRGPRTLNSPTPTAGGDGDDCGSVG